MRVVHTLVVRADPATVFAWIEEPGLARRWQPDVAEAEVLHSEPGVVGTTFREVLRDRRGQAEMEGRVTEFVPGRVLGMQMHGHGMAVTVRYEVAAHPSGTLLTAEQTLALPGRVARLVEPLVRHRVAARARHDLERLRDLCEQATAV